MKAKPLNETNPYLRDRNLSAKLVTVNVSSSTAIELGTVSPAIIKAIEDNYTDTNYSNGDVRKELCKQSKKH